MNFPLTIDIRELFMIFPYDKWTIERVGGRAILVTKIKGVVGNPLRDIFAYLAEIRRSSKCRVLFGGISFTQLINFAMGSFSPSRVYVPSGVISAGKSSYRR